MSDATSSITATLITESGDVLPIVVYVASSGEAVAFPAIEEIEEVAPSSGLPAPTKRLRKRKPPSSIHRASFHAGDQGDRLAAQWAGDELRFESFEAYGRAFIKDLTVGRLWVTATQACPGGEHALNICVPGFESIPIHATVVSVDEGRALLAVSTAGEGLGRLVPERLQQARDPMLSPRARRARFA